jgi:hypothetical protein
MNEKLNTESVRQLLNSSSVQLGQPTLARLRDARAQALERYDARSTAPAFVWAGANSTSSGHSGLYRSRYYYYCAAAVLLAALLLSFATYWQHANEHDTSDVDIAILTDDLPIDAYVE